ncbi:hypothetical protein CHISP_2505 [Chitinispirillum alkaliphilum]|nr:hypothetical protein CHISP_2505 [Chitinispirillum alkaliphilum]
MNKDYWVWMYDTNEDTAIVTHDPEGFSSMSWKLCKGVSCKDWFPENLVLELNPQRGKIITDAIHNIVGLHIVNEKLKSILETSNAEWEFFPVMIKNHKGKIMKEPYYIANLLGKIFCVDREKSICEEDSFKEGQLDLYDKLVLDQSKIPESVDFFRLGETPRVVIASDSITDKIKITEGCTGPYYCHYEDWDGFGV